MKKFLIIDGNSIVYRAYYALPFLSNSKGQFTGAIFGFLNMLLKAIEMYSPTHISIAFDFSERTFRNELFAEYKQNRKPTPPELISQIVLLKEILTALGITCIEKKGIEADDIIGTLAKQCSSDKVILSGDRDVLQLIDNNTCVWLTKKGLSEIYKINEKVLFKDFKLKPYQIIDLKGLMGDASDNIPGVRGIGPKTATMLIEQFESIENVYKNLENPNISTRIKSKLIEQKDIAFLSKKLATIKTDCEFEYNFDNFKLQLPFSYRGIELLKKYEFNSLLRREIFAIQTDDIKANKKPAIKCELNSLECLAEVCNQFNSAEFEKKEFAFSFEKEIIFAFNHEKYYIIRPELSLLTTTLDFKDCFNILKPILENSEINKIVSDLKHHQHILKNLNIKINGDIFDLKLASYLIGGSGTLDSQVEKYFALKVEFLELLKLNNMLELYYEIEIPLVNVLFDMENAGFKLDIDELNRLSEKYSIELKEITQKIYNFADEEFNINSPKQLAEILFQKLQLTNINNKKKSTGVEFLTQMEEEHPIIPQILRYRKLKKLKGTYIDAYKKIVSKENALIHTVFNQMLTSTGRLSSTEPNLQNIPIRDDEGKILRKMFISRFDEGFIISADYNQIELRLLAHCSGDERLVEAFNNNKDIHILTASQIFGVPENQVTPSQRRNAKAVNFGIIYGISDFGLSQNVGISRKSAREYIKKYFQTYPKVKEYMDNNVKLARKNGQIETIFNRIRRIPEINSNVFNERMFGERVAMNMPLQGSASDIIKIAMIKFNNSLKKQNLKSKLVLQIHDELIVDAFPTELDLIKQILKSNMENVVKLKVPLIVEITSGKTWFDCK